MTTEHGRAPLPASHRPVAAPLVDGWGTAIRSVRVSVTDWCSFRCIYCMPAEGLTWLKRDETL